MAPQRIGVTVTYMHPGVRPPVYLAGSFSDPAWHPQEMDFTTEESNEYSFYKDIMVEEGSRSQYKFRIGSGDWWELDENAPTVIDEAGNRNNLLSLPITDESATKTSAPGSPVSRPESNALASEVVLESDTAEPPHGIEQDTSLASLTQQNSSSDKQTHEGGSGNPGDGPESETPIYAGSAAEIADATVILDQEPSLVPLSNGEAGRIGDRRLSSTPVAEVANTATEATDIATIMDEDDMKLDTPSPTLSIDTHSGPGTPWQEQAPLFAHECLGPYEGGEEPQSYGDLGGRRESLVHDEQDDDLIDTDDPLLEAFPQDRLSILAHVRSTESRLSEDETNFEASPVSPLSRSKCSLLGFEEQPSSQLDLRPSPSLDVITEECQEELSLLLSLSGITESNVAQEMSNSDHPGLGATGRPTEMNVYRVGGLIDSEQDQSGRDSVLAAQVNVQDDGSTKHTIPVTAISDTVIIEPVAQTQLAANITEDVHNRLTNEVTTHPEVGQVELELQHATLTGLESIYSQQIEKESLVKTNSEASSSEPIEQKALTSEIEKTRPTELAERVVAAPGIAGNDITNQALPTADLPRDGENEFIRKERLTFSILETVDNEHTNYSADRLPLNLDDCLSRSPLEDPLIESTLPCTQVREADNPTPAIIDKTAEAVENGPQFDLPRLTEPDRVDGDFSNKDEGPHYNRTLKLETTQGNFVIQNLPISKLSANVGAESVRDAHNSAVLTSSGYEGDNRDGVPTCLPTDKSIIPTTGEIPVSNGAYVARSTAVEQSSSNDDTSVKIRNRHIAERSLTPASIRPPGKDKETRNFLQVLWHTVFVQWIGGVFARLCGGRGRPQVACHLWNNPPRYCSRTVSVLLTAALVISIIIVANYGTT